mmetsp:Transcript_42895/g.118602  ORF Transcript_42895/g.118602 Transcript_42895/m.118602 type:complete len:735 (-) Transcript_42895:110-2314(-)
MGAYICCDENVCMVANRKIGDIVTIPGSNKQNITFTSRFAYWRGCVVGVLLLYWSAFCVCDFAGHMQTFSSFENDMKSFPGAIRDHFRMAMQASIVLEVIVSLLGFVAFVMALYAFYVRHTNYRQSANLLLKAWAIILFAPGVMYIVFPIAVAIRTDLMERDICATTFAGILSMGSPMRAVLHFEARRLQPSLVRVVSAQPPGVTVDKLTDWIGTQWCKRHHKSWHAALFGMAGAGEGIFGGLSTNPEIVGLVPASLSKLALLLGTTLETCDLRVASFMDLGLNNVANASVAQAATASGATHKTAWNKNGDDGRKRLGGAARRGRTLFRKEMAVEVSSSSALTLAIPQEVRAGTRGSILEIEDEEVEKPEVFEQSAAREALVQEHQAHDPVQRAPNWSWDKRQSAPSAPIVALLARTTAQGAAAEKAAQRAAQFSKDHEGIIPDLGRNIADGVTSAVSAVGDFMPETLVPGVLEASKQAAMLICNLKNGIELYSKFAELSPALVQNGFGLYVSVRVLIGVLPVMSSFLNGVTIGIDNVKNVIPTASLPGYMLGMLVMGSIPAVLAIFGVLSQFFGSLAAAWGFGFFVFAQFYRLKIAGIYIDTDTKTASGFKKKLEKAEMEQFILMILCVVGFLCFAGWKMFQLAQAGQLQNADDQVVTLVTNLLRPLTLATMLLRFVLMHYLSLAAATDFVMTVVFDVMDDKISVKHDQDNISSKALISQWRRFTDARRSQIG